MYKYMRHLIDVAEVVAGIKDIGANATGRIDDIGMGDWLKNSKRTHITGKTEDGKDFELILEVSECQKSE